MKIKVMLVDNQIVVRQGLKALLSKEPGIEVVAESGDGMEAVDTVRRLKPDVVIMETTVPRLAGVDAIRMIKDASLNSEVIILTTRKNKTHIRDALQAGGRGYVLKTAPLSEILAAIQAAYNKSYYMSPEISADIIENFVKKRDVDSEAGVYSRLSKRERQVFRLIAEGNTTDEIADMLIISPKTVAKHRMNIMEKLQLKNTATLVRYAAQIGILDTQS